MAEALAPRFASYTRTTESIHIKDLVLFGDTMDVKLHKAGKDPVKSQGGTINYTLQSSTHARPGVFHHGTVQLKKGSWFHLIHHEEVDGEAVGKFHLCSVSGHSYHKIENVWSRYDWCHYRNWGSIGDDDEEDDDKEDEDDEDEEEDNDEDSDKENEEDDFQLRSMMHLVAVDKTDDGKYTEIGRITMDAKCIEGDWHYGSRLVDPDTQQAYAYIFGSALVNSELGDYYFKLPRSDFNVPLVDFALAHMPRSPSR